MEPISSWTAMFQHRLEQGKLLLEIPFNEYLVKIIISEYCLWIVAEWPKGGKIAFRAAFAANDDLVVEDIKKKDSIIITLKGKTAIVKTTISFPDSSSPVFRYTTAITPLFNMLMPYWPRDIMPLYKSGKTQNTKGKIHAAQVGTRSGLLFFSLEKPKTGSVFYFQDLTSLNKFCA